MAIKMSLRLAAVPFALAATATVAAALPATYRRSPASDRPPHGRHACGRGGHQRVGPYGLSRPR